MVISSKGALVVIAVLVAFDYLAVGLRFWARNIKGKPLEVNDYLIIVGLVWIRISTTVKACTSIDIGQFFTTCLCICEILGRMLDVYSFARGLF